MSRIAFATCAELLVLDPDDELLAQALRARGSDVVPCAWDDGRVDWAAFDLVLVRSPWDYHLRRDAFVQWAARVGRETLLLNPPDVIAWNTDKTYLRTLAARGVPTVPTTWVARGTTPPARLAELLPDGGAGAEADAIVKPAIGLGSSGLMRVPVADPDGAGRAHVAALLLTGDVMVQPFLTSLPQEGELSFVYFERQLSHVVRKRPTPGEYRVQPEFGAATTTEQPTEAQLEVAAQALGSVAEHELLYARVDLVSGRDGAPLVMELELVEPTLYLGAAPGAAEHFAEVVRDAIDLARLRS